jgi:hypothetical protein
MVQKVCLWIFGGIHAKEIRSVTHGYFQDSKRPKQKTALNLFD